MLLRGALVDWGARTLGATAPHVLSLPDEVLEQIALVLDQSEHFSLLDDISEICHEFLAFGRELGGWL